jgi:hypothetical protein
MLQFAIALCILSGPTKGCQIQDYQSYIYARGDSWAEQRCNALVSQFNARDIDNTNVEWHCVKSDGKTWQKADW